MADLIDFGSLAASLLDRAFDLVSAWLPGGKKIGHEYQCASLSGGVGRSCSVNLVSGKWADFQSNEGGRDLIDLYAAIHGLKVAEAARELIGNGAGRPAPLQTSAPRPERAPKSAPEGWRTVLPVPEFAPKATFKHQYRREEDIQHVGEYRVGEQLHGYVVRFRTSDGGKETLPYTWCVSEKDGAARWHWRQFDSPRPLFWPGRRLPERETVIVVEGERKGEVLQALLEAAAPGIYLVVSWPGGCKSVQKADWSPLAGRTVLLWPDCDSKHEPLTAAERKACPDKMAQVVLQQSKPLLSALEQPGMEAMLKLGALLTVDHACAVSVLPIPEPGVVADGWDAADAIETDGWDGDRVLAFFAGARTLQATPASAPAPTPAKSSSPPAPPPRDGLAAAGGEDGDHDPFRDLLEWMSVQQKCDIGRLVVSRSLLIKALRQSPDLHRCLAFNQLTEAPSTVVPWPWREKAGLLNERDDLRLGEWLTSVYGLKAAGRATLTEAIETVADMRPFHPIRDWIKSNEWDGRERLDKWLMHVLGMDPEQQSPQRRRYFELVGRFMLMGLVARVFEPGVKFDYSPVLEGPGGIGKSTFVKELVGREFFSDTHFDIGSGKDGMEQLEGIWAYELSEMTAFKRADSEQVKQFFSSTVDRFRGAYGKYVQPHPRQCVIFCTTNKRQYLYDLTGNRRFWPIWISARVLIAWLRKYRGQLFAEAYARWKSGEQFYPTPEEEVAYFYPEQELRLVETTVQSKLYEMLTREGSMVSEGRASGEFTVHTKFVTLHSLVQALGADAAKSTNLLEGQIRGWLESMGWEYVRESTGQRRRGYRQPDVWPPKFAGGEPAAGNTSTESSPGAHAPAEELEPDEPPF